MKTIRLFPVFCLILISTAYGAPKERKLTDQMNQLKRDLLVEAHNKKGFERTEAEAKVAIVSDYLKTDITTRNKLIAKYRSLQNTSGLMFSFIGSGMGGGLWDLQKSAFANLAAQMDIIEKLVPNVRKIAPPTLGTEGLGFPPGMPMFVNSAAINYTDLKPALNPHLPGYGIGMGGFGFPPGWPVEGAAAEKN